MELTIKYIDETKPVKIKDITGFKTGYGHLHYWAGTEFEHCVPYHRVEKFEFKGSIPKELQERTVKGSKLVQDD